MTDIFKKYRVPVAGMITGGILGYCYYYFIGCSTGTCAITSKPLNATLYGMVMGYLMFSVFQKPNQKVKDV